MSDSNGYKAHQPRPASSTAAATADTGVDVAVWVPESERPPLPPDDTPDDDGPPEDEPDEGAADDVPSPPEPLLYPSLALPPLPAAVAGV